MNLRRTRNLSNKLKYTTDFFDKTKIYTEVYIKMTFLFEIIDKGRRGEFQEQNSIFSSSPIDMLFSST